MVDLERIAAEIMAYYRALDESATLRHHFRHADEGGLWYIEVVSGRGELIVIKQAELTRPASSTGTAGSTWRMSTAA